MIQSGKMIELLTQPEIADKKTAWLFGGGGAAGCNQVGHICGLIEKCQWKNVILVEGISTGSLQATALAQGVTHISKLVDIWDTITFKKVCKGTAWKFLKWVNGIFGGGVYSLDPLKKLMTEFIDINLIRNSGIALRVGVVDYNLKEFQHWNPLSFPEDEFFRRIIASCSIPGEMRGQNFEKHGRNHWCFDGGVMDVIPQVDTAIEMGADRIIFSLCRSGVPLVDNDNYNTGIKTLKETLSLMTGDGIRDDLQIAKNSIERINEEVRNGVDTNKRIIDFILLEPAPYRENVGTLEFDQKKMKCSQLAAQDEAVQQAFDYYSRR